MTNQIPTDILDQYPLITVLKDLRSDHCIFFIVICKNSQILLLRELLLNVRQGAFASQLRLGKYSALFERLAEHTNPEDTKLCLIQNRGAVQAVLNLIHGSLTSAYLEHMLKTRHGEGFQM
jgi:hypothetical protein